MSSREETRQKLREAFVRALDLPAGTNCEGMQYQQEPRWDSVAHLQLILELEQAFDVAIGNDDVLNMTSFENILEILLRPGTAE